MTAIEDFKTTEFRAERAFTFGNFTKAKELYGRLYEQFPRNELYAERLGDMAFSKNRIEEALRLFQQMSRVDGHIKRAHCFRALGQKEELKKELETIGFFRDRRLKAVRDCMSMELLLNAKKYEEVVRKCQNFQEQPEWRMALLMKATLEMSDKEGELFFKNYPELFTQFRLLPRYSTFSSRDEDLLVIIGSFVDLAVDQSYKPFLKRLLFERLLKKSPNLFALDSHLQVLHDRMEGKIAEMERLLENAKKTEELLKAEKKEEERAILTRQLKELFAGGPEAPFASGMTTRANFYKEVVAEFIAKITSSTMKKKFEALSARLEALGTDVRSMSQIR